MECIYNKTKTMARNKKTLLTESTKRVPTIEKDGTIYMALSSDATLGDYENIIIQNYLDQNNNHVVNTASQLDISKSKIYGMLNNITGSETKK